MKKILFISGSLRKGSFNSSLLLMAKEILSGDYECSFLEYGSIPFMNQDLESDPGKEIERVRKEVLDADLIWIGSPEYNHSYSGVLKNLLDWLSRPVVAGDYSTAVIRGKRVALSSAAGGSAGSFSLEKLSEMLTMFGCPLIEKRTMVSLGKRFGSSTLELTEEEKKMLEAECLEIKKVLL